VDRVREALGDLCAGSFDGAKRESPLPTVMAGVEAVQDANADLIVAVGGGSAIVTARAITIVLGEGKTVGEMYTRHFPDKPPIVYRANAPKLPNILVPTTPTTGADRGGAAVWDDTPPHRKELYDPKTRPLATIVDPDALMTAPHSLYLDTCLTTFCGVVDDLARGGHSALGYADMRQALDLCLEYLPRLSDGAEARIQLFMAAVLANRASQSTYNLTGRTKTTSLDRTLRYAYPDIGQGASNAVLLPTMLRLNCQTYPIEPAELESFLHSIGAPTRLRELNIPKSDFHRLADAEAASPAFGQGATRVGHVSELVKILDMAW
jgi:alcohol dehydrogenase class IV